MDNKTLIESGNAVLGIEFGSTRIKAVLINEKYEPIAGGSFTWENSLENGVWTYPLSQIHEGLQTCYADLKKDVKEKYGIKLTKFKSGGISAMMHGYLAFDKDDKLLVPFRTWRNTITGEASLKLSKLFNFPVPERWSVSHLYQAVLNKEEHISKIQNVYTLAAYIHYKLTGEKVIGVGDASGMFPVKLSADKKSAAYNPDYAVKFEALPEMKALCGGKFKLTDCFPKVLMAGEKAGTLTAEGAKFLDPTGELTAGIPFCPPEGDMGTGMIATNSVRVGYGNSSLGTSGNITLVTDKSIAMNKEIDVIASPSGYPAVLVHANNCTTDINAWVELLHQAIVLAGGSIQRGELFVRLFNKSLEGEPDAGGLVSFNYFSGEAAVGVQEGRPLFIREPDAKMSLANFMKSHILAVLAILRIGVDILVKQGVEVNKIYGHGGFFKTPVVGAKALSAALNAPVATLSSAGEGGPYGEALLAAYMIEKEKGETLEDYLQNKIFANAKEEVAIASKEEVKGFNEFLERYKAAVPVEAKAVECVKGQHN